MGVNTLKLRLGGGCGANTPFFSKGIVLVASALHRRAFSLFLFF